MQNTCCIILWFSFTMKQILKLLGAISWKLFQWKIFSAQTLFAEFIPMADADPFQKFFTNYTRQSVLSFYFILCSLSKTGPCFSCWRNVTVILANPIFFGRWNVFLSFSSTTAYEISVSYCFSGNSNGSLEGILFKFLLSAPSVKVCKSKMFFYYHW